MYSGDFGLCEENLGVFEQSPTPPVPTVPFKSSYILLLLSHILWRLSFTRMCTLKVEIFACTNFRDRNFRENLFSRISRIWKKFAKFAKICFCEIFQNYEIREIYHKNSLIWNMNNSYTHHCIKETFLQCFGNRLCLWRQIFGLKNCL